MSKKNLVLALCLLTLTGATVCYASPEIKPNIENKMDTTMDIQVLEEYVDDNEAIGAAVGLIDHGKIQFFTYGKKSICNNELVSEDTIFEIGSITKVFTTLLLMDMVKNGEVNLDEPIQTYLPDVKVPERDGKKITFRHLATHYSGIPRLPDNFDLTDRSNPYKDYSIDDLYEFLSHHVLQKAPGDQFEYSNIGMGLLGHLLALKTGKSYEELICSRISNKLGMKNTGISLSNDMKKKFASGHQLKEEVEHWDFTQSTAGCGALRSNIKDLTQFLAANMGLLNSPISDLLKQCHQKQYELAPNTSIGLGWVINQPDDTTKIIFHNGGTGGFRSYLGFNPSTQKGVVILTNSAGDWPDELGASLLDPSYKKPQIDRELAKNINYLNKFIGSYDATVFITPDQPSQCLNIGVYGPRLYTELTCGEIAMLYPESFGVFGVQGFPDGKVYFDFDENGNVTKTYAILLSSKTKLWEATPKPQE